MGRAQDLQFARLTLCHGAIEALWAAQILGLRAAQLADPLKGGTPRKNAVGQEDSGLEKKAAAGKNPELGTRGCQERSHCAQTAQRGVCAAGSLQLGAGGACPATGGSKPPLGTEPRTFSLQD